MEHEIDGSQVVSAQATETVSQPQQSEGSEGIQKRIDELTRRFYEADAKAQLLQQQLAEREAQFATRQVSPQPQVDEIDAALAGIEQVSPEVSQAVKQALKSFQSKTEATVAQLRAKFEAQADVAQVGTVASQFGIQDPAITRRAQELIASWRVAGLPIKADDALRFALGEAALQPKQPRQTDGRYAPIDPVMTSSGAPPPPRTGPKPLPSNFNSLSPEEQIKLLEARGVGDQLL
jgi:hypothetical protein